MRIAILGAGGAGGLIGGLLIAAGHRVEFLARGRNWEALRTTGLRIESPQGAISIPAPVPAFLDPEYLVNPEVILIAVKAGQVAGLLPSLRGMLGPGTIVVTIQNGVRTVDEVRKSIGAAPTYGGSCYLVSYLSAPGNVRHVGVAPKLKIGNIASNTRNEKTAIQFINALREAGIMAEMVHDIQDVLWSKVVLAASLGVVGSLTRVKIGVFREVPETRELLSRVMLEVVAVARSRGIKMPDNWVQRTMGFVDSMPFASDSSLQRDIMHGKPSELEYVVGDLVRYAASAGFDVPILRWGYSCILAAEKQTQALTAQASR